MTDSPDISTGVKAPADSPAPPPGDRRQAWLAFWRENLSTPKLAWRTVHEFSEELRRDPSFWPHVMAMRGGLVVTGFGAAIALAYAATLPFALAATLITGTVLAAGVTTIGVIAGGRFAWGHIRRAVHTVKHGDNVPLPPVSNELPRWMQKLGENKYVKAIGKSRAWKRAGAVINSQKKWMLGGTALGGSALTAGMGLWMLAAQAVVLPVVVLGMAVSVATLWGVGTIVTGCVGLYFGTTSLLRWHRESKQAKAATAAAEPVAKQAPTVMAPAMGQTPDCNAAFAAAQESKPVVPQDNTPQPVKKTSPRTRDHDKV